MMLMMMTLIIIIIHAFYNARTFSSGTESEAPMMMSLRHSYREISPGINQTLEYTFVVQFSVLNALRYFV